MTRAVIRIHIYAALLTVVNLMVYTITGVYVALHLKGAGAPVVQYIQYHPAEGEKAQVTADRVVKLLGLSLATPIQPTVIQYTPTGGLVLHFYHANGRHKVTFLYDRNQLRVEITRNTAANYAAILHLTTGAFRSGDWRMQFWAYENEFALWCFLALLASAVWMAAARFRQLAATRLRALHLAAGALFFPFALLLGITAIQMAHYHWLKPIIWATRLHRSSTIVAVASAILIPVVACSGVWLWIRTRPRMGWVAGSAVGMVMMALIVWMRV